MNRIYKTILIISIFLPFALAQAQVDNLVVEFQQTPLFNEANFLPGEGVSRWVKVTNNSGAIQRIATLPLNITDPNRLGDVLNLEIKEGGTTRYNNALSNFLANGEVYLSDLANGANTQYDFTVSFYSGAQNTFQGKSLGFDILVGFQGTEGGLLPGAGSGGGPGGGGILPMGLTIQNQAVVITTDVSVVITWNTSYSATSQVIYAKEGEKHILDLTDNTGTPPKYGYSRTTPESDTSPKQTYHSIVITGLTPGTKYYYRTVSHASLAIGEEASFTTKGSPTVLTESELAILAREGIILGGPSETISRTAEEQILPTKTGGIEETDEEGVLIEGEKPSFIRHQVALIFGAISQNYLILFLILLLILIIIIAQGRDKIINF